MTAGQKVLVYGSTGGVGHLVVQMAKLRGAEVYAMVSGEKKAAFATAIGADHCINYKESTVEEILTGYTGRKGFDIVFDTVGNENLLNSFQLAKIGGSIVTILSLTSLDISLLHEKALNLHVVYMITPLLDNDNEGKEKLGDILNNVTQLAEAGKIRPFIDRTFSFNEVAKAHEYAEKESICGKVVITNENSIDE